VQKIDICWGKPFSWTSVDFTVGEVFPFPNILFVTVLSVEILKNGLYFTDMYRHVVSDVFLLFLLCRIFCMATKVTVPDSAFKCIPSVDPKY
jgi:hypothetical protein